MRRVPAQFLVVAAVAMLLSLIALVSAAASSSLLPGPVLWLLAVLVASVLTTSVVELGRRKARGPEADRERITHQPARPRCRINSR